MCYEKGVDEMQIEIDDVIVGEFGGMNHTLWCLVVAWWIMSEPKYAALCR